MVAMVSLALLKLPLVINRLLESEDVPALVAEQPDASPYMIDPAAINEINEILLGAAGAALALHVLLCSPGDHNADS
jgi:hypothetical protein